MSSSLSSSSTSSNPFQEGWTSSYDVFLIYHDKHIAQSFLSHLHSALKMAGFRVFIVDYEGTSPEDHTNSSVMQTIKESRSSIIVFSTNFVPFSTLFLQAMEYILECRRTLGQLVLPVYYDVDPFDIRHQKGIFGEAFEDLAQSSESTFRKDELMRFRAALTEAVSIPGFHIMNSRNETEVINDVVAKVTRLLDENDLFVADHPVGVESRVQDVIQLLNNQPSKDPLLLGIWGMGGIGKTTVAKAVYNQIRQDFEASSFLFNIGDTWKFGSDKASFQQQLLSDIYKTTEIKIYTVESGKLILKERLCKKKIFVVIDDVNKLDQLDALCGSRNWFGEGTRIIITTRDVDLLKKVKVDHVYRMKEMDDTESLELFNWHAFNQSYPKEGFTDLSRDFVEYCGGLPLALEVSGRFLFDRPVDECKIVLEKLRVIPNDKILMRLSISFDDLDDNEKEIFLNIASVFIGMGKDDVIQTLTYSGCFPEIGIKVLEDKSLVTVDSKNRIGMHTLVRAMGREIIRQQTGMAETKLYDVFLSFSGEDCRGKFISHLYSSLQNAGIYVFKDDDGIKRGDQISVSLLQAIRQSEICIVVLSTNYANSKWCMLELERIVEVGRTEYGNFASVL